nr:MAG TPA: hypothetical protein [Caudoviricetes sp.]
MQYTLYSPSFNRKESRVLQFRKIEVSTKYSE